MASNDCLDSVDKPRAKEDAHRDPLDSSRTVETNSDVPNVDNRDSQSELTDPTQPFTTEALTTKTTNILPSSSVPLPDPNISEKRNPLRPVDFNSGPTQLDNNDTEKKNPVREGAMDNSNTQTKNNPTSSVLQNGESLRRRVGATSDGRPTTSSSHASSYQQMTPMNGRECAQVVRAWLWQYHQWNSMCTFGMMLPYYAMATFPYYAANNSPSSIGARPSPLVNDGAAGPAGNNNNQMGAAAVPPNNGGRGNQSQAPQQNFRGSPSPTYKPPNTRVTPGTPATTEYMVPSLWKRILAESVDFVLLFYIKLVISVMAMKRMGYIDLEKFDVEYSWLIRMDEFDLSKFFHFTSEVILFELLNRISITIVETMCLRRGIGVVGGATPGKRLLGMKVVSCTDILDLGNGRIQVTPAGDLGLYSALLRSILKNFTIAFFFPACLTVFFFEHNRAAYDVLAGTIVVQSVEEEEADEL